VPRTKSPRLSGAETRDVGLPELDASPPRNVKIFLGCPMYDGRCHAEFTFAMCKLSALCTQLGIELQIYFASGEALVMKARNAIADHFLRSDASHLMLIDADIGFSARDVIALLDLQMRGAGQNGYDVVTAPYPLKRLAWDKIAQAAKQGLADGDATALRRYAAEFRIYPAHDGRFDVSQPVEVTQAATGFMMIRRSALDKFRDAYPGRRYNSSQLGIEQDCSQEITQFFDTAIDGHADSLHEDMLIFLARNPAADRDAMQNFLTLRDADTHNYISEDFMFCRLIRRLGLKVWTCPWMNLSHIGSHMFDSRLVDLARLGPI
jgi:hypothetical protein